MLMQEYSFAIHLNVEEQAGIWSNDLQNILFQIASSSIPSNGGLRFVVIVLPPTFVFQF